MSSPTSRSPIPRLFWKRVDVNDNRIHSLIMTCGQTAVSGCNQGQFMVDEGPRYDKKRRRRGRRESQVMGKNLIRPDKRKKVKWL